MSAEPVIAARALSRSFGRRRTGGRRGAPGGGVLALDQVSFEADRGEVLAVVGENGAGKTTLLKCLIGALRPTGGEVTVLGFTPHQRRHALLRQIGLVLGSKFALHPDLSVRQSFEYLRIIYGRTRSEFDARFAVLVDDFQLGPLLDRPARQLSLGQRMRCELASALLHTPSLVLLDEPTLGLDHETQLAMRAMVLEYVAETAATVLLTSHYAEDIETLADRVLLLRGGKLVGDVPIGEAREAAARLRVVAGRHDGDESVTAILASLRTRRVGSVLEVFVAAEQAEDLARQLRHAGMRHPAVLPCALADALTHLAWRASAPAVTAVAAPGVAAPQVESEPPP